ncbi:hypothetical protein HMPREF9120_02040 [Neisseria sp. oral taxon 020 str. F0370]|nr:hypothetical protein HMPREF9120_02040 [Neisseria sp. oral taxon 020 str. F0370]
MQFCELPLHPDPPPRLGRRDGGKGRGGVAVSDGLFVRFRRPTT